jgi:DNA-binding NarL/FixJ family response regulator
MSRGPVRVLLCDDAEEMRMLLRWALEPSEAVIVGEAGDGDAALALAGTTPADVIVLDLQMPGPVPADLLVALREAAPDVPIVTFSGFDPDLVAGRAAGLVARHVPKTTDLALVRDTIVQVGRGG